MRLSNIPFIVTSLFFIESCNSWWRGTTTFHSYCLACKLNFWHIEIKTLNNDDLYGVILCLCVVYYANFDTCKHKCCQFGWPVGFLTIKCKKNHCICARLRVVRGVIFLWFLHQKIKNILNQSVIESWIKMYLLIRIHYSHQVSEQCIFKGYCTSAWLNPESRHWLETMVQGICALCPFSIIYNINMWSPDSTLFDTAWHYDKYSGLGWENTTLFGEGFSPANCPKVWKYWQ